MSKTVFAWLLLSGLWLGDARAAALPAGSDAFVLDLNDARMRARIKDAGGAITNDGPGGALAVRFTLEAKEPGVARNVVTFPVDVSSLLGAHVMLVAKVRGQDIRSADPAKKLAANQGIELRLVLPSGSGKNWPATPPPHGTFDWRDASHRTEIRTPAPKAAVSLGLTGAVGTVWLSDMRLRVLHSPVDLPKATATTRAAAANARTTLRGVMSPGKFNIKDFADLQKWNVNLIRWQITGAHQAPSWQAWLDKQLAELPRALDAAAAHNIKVIIDLHSKPGGNKTPSKTTRMLMEKEFADEFVAIWETIVRRHKDHPALYAYDLVNEPVQYMPSPAGVDDWYALQVRAAHAIRAIDPKTPIMFETEYFDSPWAFAWLKPVDLPNIIYQAHVYFPHTYTHQGVKTDQGLADGKNYAAGQRYPGVISGTHYDKESLRKHVQPIRDFQLATGAPIFIGEFSAARWAPGAAQYIDDCISLFEEYGWDWTYHAFRESTIWDVEHVDDSPRAKPVRAPADQPTERQKVLLKWFTKNNSQ
ncbi:glycoside hydrolase family 5 protein [Geminisphaera colitermitum]|uniref:glycoside hydrolase family 5 protein n=1 Tax=Geminisphaera colitermitum TaxID=1148786 RepID=UPI000158C942|nr:cellulase family glycosylhydrolase [Geminisphaera colitermitum]